jgi:signal transduction histidine kinase
MLSSAVRRNPHRFRTKHPIIFTFALVAVTSGIQYVLWPYIRQGPFILFYPAMVVAAVYGHAPLALLLSCIVVKALFYEPQFSMVFEPHDAIFFGTFALASILIWQLGRALRAALDEMEHAIQAREEFLSVASHELRTPLTSLKLQNQIRGRNIEKGILEAFSPDKLKRMMTIDGLQIDRLIRLVDDMLDISRIRTGRLTMDFEDMDFSALVRDMTERLHAQLEAAGCKVEMDCQAPLNGHWDRFRLEQVVANILVNAAKYGEGKPVHVSTLEQAGHAVLKVKDHGRGIDPESLQRIFERFERAIKSSEVSGLGLGLYIAREIITQHGGTISVESQIGAGSTFTVALPMNK